MVEIGTVPCRFLGCLIIIVGCPLTVLLQDAHDGVTFVVAHPEVAVLVEVEGCDTHILSRILVVGQDTGQRRIFVGVMIHQFVVLELIDA